MLQRYDDSQQYLLDHPHLACEEAANYLVLWCVNLEVEEVSICDGKSTELFKEYKSMSGKLCLRIEL